MLRDCKIRLNPDLTRPSSSIDHNIPARRRVGEAKNWRTAGDSAASITGRMFLGAIVPGQSWSAPRKSPEEPTEHNKSARHGRKKTGTSKKEEGVFFVVFSRLPQVKYYTLGNTMEQGSTTEQASLTKCVEAGTHQMSSPHLTRWARQDQS